MALERLGVAFAGKWRASLDLFTTLIILMAAGAVLKTYWFDPKPGRRETPVPKQPISLVGAPSQGSPTARVGVIEFSDFQCPYCGRFAREVFPAIESDYVKTGRVLFVFRQMPLSIHRFAAGAAHASECAAEQGRFWEMHDRMFRDQAHLAPPDLTNVIRAVGADESAYDACMSRSNDAKVQSDIDEGRRLGVIATPTFFVGALQPTGQMRVSKVFVGSQQPQDFHAALDALLR